MIGTNLILQEEYSDSYLLPQPLFEREDLVDHLAGLTQLELTVTDSETDKPIPKAMISIDLIGRTAVCDVNGKVLIDQILSEEVIVDVIVNGYCAHTVNVHLSVLNPNKLKVRMVRNC